MVDKTQNSFVTNSAKTRNLVRWGLPCSVFLVICCANRAPAVAHELADAKRSDVSQQAKHAQDIVFFAASKPILIRVYVQVDGSSMSHARTNFAQRLFRSLDNDADDTLSPAEAQRVPAMGRYADGPPALGDKWSELDNGPRDGRLTLPELVQYINQALGRPFAMQTGPQRAAEEVKLFDRLDLDGDRRLTGHELASRAVSLEKLDYDDDQTISTVELLPFRNPFQKPMC